MALASDAVKEDGDETPSDFESVVETFIDLVISFNFCPFDTLELLSLLRPSISFGCLCFKIRDSLSKIK